ncbi:eukaryotic translation initiation factor 3 subunit I [Lepeophtheirus salmonis]|uniref:Eukaryotic translation initiation factor 3 subunit I n=1 Tax=Lepeophtheirus salmonis TaxID=72036 RepID=C1BVX2_LEPSM|nr:eukaryotic translation initiation factor 3 subunit I-like [Lepeophtheirus salmonis]ACO13175.1 Eukaryotic translation initiation factor 3 subunit I [Lepeophtheirus salmonis]ADD24386.1 Eukaryotic translation initiation factor 3 subunit I [Lepeophtheirus salmonis]ADD38381.1 Eukaryotic translation initiation factor 3 subunit I [Lepeophtheirus salmonis]
MRPIALLGHDRSITQIRYNREGDLLFSCAKDKKPNVWYTVNGERLGTFNGHTGALWCLDVDWTSTHLITGAGDNTVRLWDVETGSSLGIIDTSTSVRTCGFSFSGNYVAYTTDNHMKFPCTLSVIDVRQGFKDQDPIMKHDIPMDGPKITALIWFMDNTIITGHENGNIAQWDVRMNKKLHVSSDHTKTITDIQPSGDASMFISSSKDYTAKLFDLSTLKCMKTYKTERPVNSASLSPKMDHVLLGGGQEAMDVTMTSTRIGKFDARFFHVVFEEEFGRVKGHFGPINSVQFHPDGLSYASGGEDGYVRVQSFDPSYFENNFGF